MRALSFRKRREMSPRTRLSPSTSESSANKKLSMPFDNFRFAPSYIRYSGRRERRLHSTQLGILAFSFRQDCHVGIGTFPKIKEGLVSSLGLRIVSGHRIGSA
jgi:hypothetical protein